MIRLIRVTEVDFSDWGYDRDTYARMIRAQRARLPVTVLCRAIDNGNPEHDYYDVQLEDGTVLEAVQGVHLYGIADWTPVVGTLGAQYTVELLFADYTQGTPIDHDELELLILRAVQEKLKTLQTVKATVGSVCYETDYSVAKPEDL